MQGGDAGTAVLAPPGCRATSAQAPLELLRSRAKGIGCPSGFPAEMRLPDSGVSALGGFFN